MDDEKRLQLLIAAVQLFGQVLSEDEIQTVKTAVFKSLGVDLPEAEVPSPFLIHAETALD